MKRIVSKVIYIILIVAATILLVNFARVNTRWIEFNYSRNIYLKISNVLSSISSSLPISFYELIISLGIIFLGFTIYKVLKIHTVNIFINSLLNIFCVISTLVFLFWGLWGINNYRYTIDTSLGIERGTYTVEELEATCMLLADKTNEYREKMKCDSNGIAIVDGGYKYILNTSKAAYDIVSKDYEVIPTSNHIRPKAMLFSEIMSRLNFTGVYNPFFSEANINKKEPIFKLPFTVCHEIAHQMGFPKENEANFISFLTCIKAGDISFNYAGYLSGLIYCSNALYKESPQLWEKVRETYSEGVLKDMAYNNEYWQKYQGFMADLGEANNNTFLKYTNQPEGTKSYGLVVDLIIAYLNQ